MATYSIGDYAQGGIVVYVDDSGEHGFAIPAHQIPSGLNPFGYSWEKATKMCSNYSSGGYSDWVLPSKTQLNSIYTMMAGFDDYPIAWVNYWTSTVNVDYGEGYYWYQNMESGVQSSGDGKHWLLPIRTF